RECGRTKRGQVALQKAKQRLESGFVIGREINPVASGKEKGGLEIWIRVCLERNYTLALVERKDDFVAAHAGLAQRMGSHYGGKDRCASNALLDANFPQAALFYAFKVNENLVSASLLKIRCKSLCKVQCVLATIADENVL